MSWKITDKTHYCYRGRCRICGTDVTFQALTKDKKYLSFRKIIITNYFPAFSAECENCQNESIFDLMGMSNHDESINK